MRRNCDFIHAIVEQATRTTRPHFTSLYDLLSLRRRIVGVMPGFVFPLYVNSLDLLRGEHIEHPTIRAIKDAAVDAILLTNDLLSYQKEGPDHEYNIVTYLIKYRGYGAQGAYNHDGKRITKALQAWEVLLRQVPRWGAEVDKQVGVYLDGIRNHAVANANWSFRCKKFLGMAVRCKRRGGCGCRCRSESGFGIVGYPQGSRLRHSIEQVWG
jgi:hypothetical protein